MNKLNLLDHIGPKKQECVNKKISIANSCFLWFSLKIFLFKERKKYFNPRNMIKSLFFEEMFNLIHFHTFLKHFTKKNNKIFFVKLFKYFQMPTQLK